MRPDDGGSSRPPLPAEAGPNERTLYEVYDFQTGIADLTASDWATSAESVRGLSADVRGIVSALRGAPDAWSGPAAEAAYQSLGKLADNLDGHAEEIDRIEAGLTGATDSATAARTAYVAKVRSVSLDVDPADYQRTPFTQPTQVSADLPTVLDQQKYDQAVAGARAAREQQAAAVLATFTDSMTTATKKLPVEPSDPADVPGGTGTSGGSGRTPSGGGSTPSGSSHLPPGGTGDPGPGHWTPTDVTGGDDLPGDDDTGDDDTDTDTDTGGGGANPWPPVDPLPPVLDGPVDGTTTPGGGGGTVGALPGSTTPGASTGQLGPAGAAAGMGGMLAGGGAAAVLGRAGMPGGAAAGRMPGSVVSSSTSGVAGRSGTAGASSGAGRSSVLAGGGQGGAARGGAAGRGSGVRTGRYGVPKLGEGAGGRGAVGAAGGAGSRGGTTEREDAADVDHLTREDEETWFEGAEDATPPVWE